MNAFIMCDASHDNEIGAAGLAGSIVVDGVAERFSEIRAQIEKSHEAELEAILVSLKKLNERIVNSDHEITHVHIFSDCLTAINTHDKDKKENKKNRSMYHQINSMVQSMKISSTFHKVKGHVKASEASNLEKRHNEIDKMARQALQELRKSLYSPKKDTPYYGVVLSRNPHKKHYDALHKMGKDFAEKGMIPRVLIEDGGTIDFRKHPFTLGHYEGMKSLDVESPKKHSPKLIESCKEYWGSNEPKRGVNGLDSCLISKVLFDQGKKNVSFYNDLHNYSRGGAVSRLIYGLQKKGKGSTGTPYIRLEEPSSFIINLSTDRNKKFTVNYWLNEYAKLVDIPIYKNFKEAVNAHKLVVEKEKELACEM